MSRETTLSHDTTDERTLDRLLVKFVAQIADELRSEGYVARTIVLKLRHADFHTVTRRRTLPEATDLDRELLAPARELFRPAFAEAQRRHQAIRLIGVAATTLSQSAPADLFESAERTRLRELTHAVDQVRARFGFDAVAPAETLGLSRRNRK